MTPAGRLAALFPHARGPAEPTRSVPVGELREWPALWAADPRVLTAIGDAAVGEVVRTGATRLRCFAAADPAFPDVPLLPASDEEGTRPGDAADPRLPPGTGVRDKLWQRLVVEDAGLLLQPGFAAVDGERVRASNAPWAARLAAVDCRPVAADLLSAAVPDSAIVVEGIGAGVVAWVGGDGVRVASRSSHVTTLLGGSGDCYLPAADWPRFASGLAARPLPLGVTKVAFNPAVDLADALRACPGSYVLKPRYGSNGVGVVRVTAHPDGRLAAASDCPATALYLDEFPADPRLRGADVVAAAATHRGRFLDRATPGVPERVMDLSILEEEIRSERAEGSVFEPRVILQRVRDGGGESFATLGAICKRIDTAVGASVARGFREKPLDVSVRRFLADRVPAADLALRVEGACGEILAAGERVRAALVPLVEARGARVHQIGIDCRLCWNPATGRPEFPFLEFQLGIGRVDWAEVGIPAFAGYETPADLRRRYGEEVG